MAAPITVIAHPRRDNPTMIADGLRRSHIAAGPAGHTGAMTSRTPDRIVTGFLDALARGDSAAAMVDVADDLVYTNVGFPTIRGKRRVAGLFGRMDSSPIGFNYRMVNIAVDDSVVLTERIDEIRWGRFILQFWVCGRFEVADARITVWRDYFDFFDCAKAAVRAVVGVLLPVVQPLPERITLA